jgi:DAPG hydrolase PhiG domain
MRLDQADQLLEPGYLDLESGTRRLDDGTLHVASRTTMVGCKGRMIDFWFGFIETTEHYKWWHPKDHVWCEWVGERGTGRYVGGTHNVHEFIGGELMKLKIHFRPPSELLDVSRFASAGVSTAVCGRVGVLDAPVWAGHLIHLVRDTDYGCEMRSRFWLGDFDPPALASTREARIQAFPDRVGAALHKHCNEEMGYLAQFLPGLYAREAR